MMLACDHRRGRWRRIGIALRAAAQGCRVDRAGPSAGPV